MVAGRLRLTGAIAAWILFRLRLDGDQLTCQRPGWSLKATTQ